MLTESGRDHSATSGPQATPAAPAVSLRGVNVTYCPSGDAVHALRDVQFDLAYGEFACVLGASGSGKSTLVNVIAGLQPPDDGSVQVAAREWNGTSEQQRSRLRLEHVGVVFQDNNLIHEFTARENVALPLEASGHSYSTAGDAADHLMSLVGLDGLGDRFPRQLSGGQRQRVGIARALSGNRKILLADEPTGALDSANSRALFAVFRSLARQGTAVLLVTHDLECRPFVDQVYRMSDGRLTRGHPS
jgi:ABC-type lipoprotein export system ATPase subunit